ncbi:MAG: sulfurtransferase complex subunit TusB [Candidatus Methanofastidiosia archaeon]
MKNTEFVRTFPDLLLAALLNKLILFTGIPELYYVPLLQHTGVQLHGNDILESISCTGAVQHQWISVEDCIHQFERYHRTNVILILFIEDGVYAVTSDQIHRAEQKGIKMYALKADLEARGIQSKIPVVDYTGFVDLVEENTVVTWS